MDSVRKVVVYEYMTLDGVAENVAGFFTEWDDPEVDAAGAAAIATQDAVILGRRSYDEWVTFWPGSDIQPFASFINKVPKYIATSTPLEREWANASAIGGGLVDFVRDLKNRPGGDIGVHGSISVAQTLLAAGLVDELRLVIAQTIAGVGRKLLDGLPPIRLAPIRTVAMLGQPAGHVQTAADERADGVVSPAGFMIVDSRVIG